MYRSYQSWSKPTTCQSHQKGKIEIKIKMVSSGCKFLAKEYRNIKKKSNLKVLFLLLIDIGYWHARSLKSYLGFNLKKGIIDIPEFQFRFLCVQKASWKVERTSLDVDHGWNILKNASIPSERLTFKRLDTRSLTFGTCHTPVQV